MQLPVASSRGQCNDCSLENSLAIVVKFLPMRCSSFIFSRELKMVIYRPVGLSASVNQADHLISWIDILGNTISYELNQATAWSREANSYWSWWGQLICMKNISSFSLMNMLVWLTIGAVPPSFIPLVWVGVQAKANLSNNIYTSNQKISR